MNESPPSYKLSTGAVIQPDITLVATGSKPNSDELGLESVGLTSGVWIPVNEYMQTPVDSIYAVGDVNGSSLLDSSAAAQANIAIENILGRPIRFDKRWFSQFLHTKPPIASIGWNEEEADILLVSAGFDAFMGDPLTEMSLEQEHFANFGRRLKETGLATVVRNIAKARTRMFGSPDSGGVSPSREPGSTGAKQRN